MQGKGGREESACREREGGWQASHPKGGAVPDAATTPFPQAVQRKQHKTPV